MRHLGTLSLIALLATASGCNLCCWGKRNAELTGPTDIRKSQLWCLGEDALFHQPMGPSNENYGLKKTCWREWPADGAPCANGSCGPMLMPSGGQSTPSPHFHHEPAPGNEPYRQINPFSDDPQPIPAAAGATGASPGSSSTRIGATQPREFPSLFNPGGVAPQRISTKSAEKKLASKPTVPPRVITVPAPPLTPTLIPKSATAPANPPDRRKMTISEPIDTPTRNLAEVTSLGSVIPTSVTTASPGETRATLASLQHMIDVDPTSSDSAGPGPAVIRNEYAPQAKPFALATRSTLAKQAAVDPELAEQTLSALGSMMGDEESANEN